MAWWQPELWYWRWPTDFGEWFLWGAWGVVLLAGVWRWRTWHRRPWRGVHAWVALSLFVLAWIGPRLKAYPGYTPLPWGTWGEEREAIWLPLGSLAWGLAAGWLGVGPGMALAVLVGALRGWLWAHSAMSLWAEPTLALAVAWAAYQPYRTRFFRWLRTPWGSALLAWGASAALLLGEAFLSALRSAGPWVNPGVYGVQWLFRGAELLAVVLVASVCRSVSSCLWGREEQEARQPSPLERSLTSRFAGLSIPLALGIALVLVTVSGVVALQVARQMLKERMGVIVDQAATNLPTFLEEGQQRLRTLAETLSAAEAPISEEALAAAYRQVFFTRLMVVNAAGEMLVFYPQGEAPRLSPEERTALAFALSGVPVQVVTSPALGERRAGWVTFVAPLAAREAVLLGRADLARTPISEAMIRVLDGVRAGGGLGVVLDDRGQVLYPVGMAQAPVAFRPEEWVAQGRALQIVEGGDGQRYWMLARQTLGQPWWVVVLLPVAQVRQVAFRLAWPLVAVALALYGLSLVGMYSLLRVVTQSLRTLAQAAQRIARGDLEHPLEVEGVDEVGQLRLAFETMRRGLKARLTELAQLLEVSQRVARADRVEDVVLPVLQAARQVRPQLARIVLLPEALPTGAEPTRRRVFSVGVESARWKAVDDTVIDWVRQKSQVVLRHPYRVSGWPLAPQEAPGGLIALPLRFEEHFFGAFYVLLPEGQEMDPHMLNYVRTLAGQLSLALANVRLLLEIQLDKQRLEAILASSPDPVLVTDMQGNLLLSNPAAMDALGVRPDHAGRPIGEVLAVPDLVDMFTRSAAQPMRVTEVTLEGGRVFFVSVSEVRMAGRPVGRVALLRDVTRYKELDALKSEFVATVSHDLRSPLTLLRGYATMLDLTASLDERQRQYLRQILQAVENMSHLVNNLLDLGRIEAGVGLQLQQFAPEDLARRVIEIYYPKAEAKRIQIQVDVAPDVPPVIEGDKDLLERALGNLVDNAIKYTPPEGQVTLRIEPFEEDQVLFAVQDTGVGIAPVDQPRLFERFFRVRRRDVQRQQGSGLGLSIVKSIVERHHGRVWVESQLGKGSTFFVALPVRQPREVAGRPQK